MPMQGRAVDTANNMFTFFRGATNHKFVVLLLRLFCKIISLWI